MFRFNCRGTGIDALQNTRWLRLAPALTDGAPVCLKTRAFWAPTRCRASRVTISLIALVASTQPTAAQINTLQLHDALQPLGAFQIVEVGRRHVIVRPADARPAEGSRRDREIICEDRSLVVRDRAAATQDVYGVDVGFCDGLIDAAYLRLESGR
jgi:hypothetical protein